MGGLTLNVLLSFAQFEREVTAERIRDKVAASKKKGMWMGGIVPLGYRAQDRKLVIDEANAAQVRQIFQRYLELRSVAAVVRELNAARATSSGEDTTGHSDRAAAPQSRGKIYYLLSNPIYIGKIRHKAELHDGEHQAIIDTETFEAVQSLLAQQTASPRGSVVHPDNHLLTGRIYDENGNRLTPVHAQNHGKRYRYYVTDTRRSGSTKGEKWRIAASAIEPIVEAQLMQLLSNRSQLSRWIEQFGMAQDLHQQLENAGRLEEHIASDQTGASRKAMIGAVFRRVTIGSKGIHYDVDGVTLVDIIANHTQRSDAETIHQAINNTERTRAEKGQDDSSPVVQMTQHTTLKRCGVEMRIIVDDGAANPVSIDQTLIETLAKAHAALGALTDASNRGVADVAQSMDMDASDLSRILPLAFLSPKLTEAILTGRQPADLTLRKLTRGVELPVDWSRQDEVLAG